jgi:hypothetical protein
MTKRVVLFVAAIVASGIYDFYLGYHETRSILGGLIWVVGGLIVLALFWCCIPTGRIYEQTKNFKTATTPALPIPTPSIESNFAA